jgi:hypothetical protein
LVSGEKEEKLLKASRSFRTKILAKEKVRLKNGTEAPVQRLREYDHEMGNTNLGR